jgi:hypothetical protein
MTTTEKFRTPTPPVGVIESLSQGFETVASSLGLLLLPLLIDLLLWVGPRVSFGPAIEAAYREFWKPALVGSEQQVPDTAAELFQFMATASETVPPVYLPVLGVPSLMAWHAAQPLPFSYTPPVWVIDTTVGMMGVELLALGGGVILISFYLTLIAQQVGEGKISLKNVLARLPINVFWFSLFVIGGSILLFAMFLPFFVLATGLSLFNGFLGNIATIAGMVFLLWISLFGIFTVHSIAMNRRSLFGALWDSVRVVQWNMSATLFLVLLIVVLNSALSFVWSLADMASWLALPAIAGNAFISTGLWTATFVFFKDRYRYWREMREELIAELERRRIQQHRS